MRKESQHLPSQKDGEGFKLPVPISFDHLNRALIGGESGAGSPPSGGNNNRLEIYISAQDSNTVKCEACYGVGTASDADLAAYVRRGSEGTNKTKTYKYELVLNILHDIVKRRTKVCPVCDGRGYIEAPQLPQEQLPRPLPTVPSRSQSFLDIMMGTMRAFRRVIERKKGDPAEWPNNNH